ncbi:serine protease, partial [Salmonella enterica subsp. enterica]|nr:serine protease [Salmonella enterica subsp. enterica serovar Enteritidis]
MNFTSASQIFLAVINHLVKLLGKWMTAIRFRSMRLLRTVTLCVPVLYCAITAQPAVADDEVLTPAQQIQLFYGK